MPTPTTAAPDSATIRATLLGNPDFALLVALFRVFHADAEQSALTLCEVAFRLGSLDGILQLQKALDAHESAAKRTA